MNYLKHTYVFESVLLRKPGTVYNVHEEVGKSDKIENLTPHII